MGCGHAESGLPRAHWLAFMSSTGPRGRRTVTALQAYTDLPDEELLALAGGGDARAFDQIVARHGGFALRVARRIVSSSAVAEELVQEALIRAWSQSRNFDPRRARFSTWLYKIVVNLCMDHRRRIQHAPLPEGLDPADSAPNADRMLEISQRDAAIAKAIEELPARQRAAMVLVYDEGMSGSAAAAALGLSVKAVERLLARARKHVRARLQPEHDELG